MRAYIFGGETAELIIFVIFSIFFRIFPLAAVRKEQIPTKIEVKSYDSCLNIVFVQHSCGISRRDGPIFIDVLRLQTKKILVYLSHFTQYSSKGPFTIDVNCWAAEGGLGKNWQMLAKNWG